jgi:integrase
MRAISAPTKRPGDAGPTFASAESKIEVGQYLKAWRRGRDSNRNCGVRYTATLIYRRTGNLRAVQLLLGHTKIESTVRYLGIEVDDALSIAEQVDL